MAEPRKGVLQSKTFSFEWTVERFFADCKKIGDRTKSPAFPINYSGKVTNWSLTVYPNGINNLAKDSISLYLYFHSDDVSEVTVDYQLSIVSEKCRLSKLDKAKAFKGPTASWGWPTFEKQDIIKDTKNGVLMNDTLTISCKVIFNRENENFYGYDEWLGKMRKGFDEYETLLESNCFSDVTFRIQDKEIHLHKALLTCRNPVFRAMFEHEMKEKNESLVDITDVDYEVMKELFRFIYTGNVENIEKIAKDLLIAADKYAVTELKALCEKTLYDNLSVDNAIEYLKLTEMCDTLHLKKLVIKFVVDNLADIVRKSSFKVTFADLDRDVVFEIMEAVADKD